MIMDMVQKRIIRNKVEKGFNTTDIEQEFANLKCEVEEALDAYRNESVGRVAEELADVAIYTLGIAQLLGIDMEAAIENKMTVNEDRVYVKREDGTQAKLGKIYLPSGEELGTPFGKIMLDENGNVDCGELIKLLGRFYRRYFEYPYPTDDLQKLILVRFDENEVEQRKLAEVAEEVNWDRFEYFVPAINGKKLVDFFMIDLTQAEIIENSEFILLYKECKNELGEVDDIKFYLTYLQPYTNLI